jgi:putative oxidoreductase
MNSMSDRHADGIPSQGASPEITRPVSGQPHPSSTEGRGTGTDGRRLPACRLNLPLKQAACINGILRLLVGGMFVLAGVLKIADPAKFAQDVGNYRLMPHELTNLVAILVPWIELTAGVLVLTGIWLRAAALVITSLTAMFFLIIVSALARGLNIECGCFGTVGGRHVGLVNLAIDSTLLVLAALLAWRSRDRPTNPIFSKAGAQSVCRTT